MTAGLGWSIPDIIYIIKKGLWAPGRRCRTRTEIPGAREPETDDFVRVPDPFCREMMHGVAETRPSLNGRPF